MVLPLQSQYRIQYFSTKHTLWGLIGSNSGKVSHWDVYNEQKILSWRKKGNFRYQVNSHIHLQTVEIQMRRLLMSRLISIFTICLVNLFFIPIQSTLDTSNFKGMGKICRVISSSRYPNHDVYLPFWSEIIHVQSSINRSLYGAISLINYGMNWPKNQLTFEIETLEFLRYSYSPDIMTIFSLSKTK